MAPIQTRVLTLNKGDHQEKSLYRLEKGWILRFVLGPSLMGHKIRIFTNHPPSYPTSPDEIKAVRYNRSEFHELPWTPGSKLKHDDLDQYAEIKVWLAGPFSYFFLLDTDDITNPNGSGYYQVPPTLTVGPKDDYLPLDCIQCQTIIAKLLGPFPEWEGRFSVAKESGYNMIHLTPTQRLGVSNSAYSLADQLQLNPIYNSGDTTFSYDDIKQFIAKLKNGWNMLTLSDVVFNHTSKCSPWLKEHPECAYNLQNSPHLRPAFVLDRALNYFGQEVAENEWEHRGLPADIREGYHLDALRHILQDELIPSLKLHEYFQVDVDDVTKKFANELEGLNSPYTDKPPVQYSDVCLTIVQDPEYKRFGSGVNIALALMIYNKPRGTGLSEMERKKQCVGEFRQKLVELNNQAAGKCWEHLCVAINAVIGHVRYERVDGHGPRIHDYSESHPLITRYFTYDGTGSDVAFDEQLMYSTKNASFMAFNGWVMADDPLNNFAEPHSMVYFRRELVCWGDCVKLRYGEKPEDCPYLWERMTKYSQLTAEVFHGLRLDNCHSTPIHVAEYLLDKAREVRRELYVVAELFTGGEMIDNIFVNRLGITSLIREAQVAGDSHEEGRLVYRYGGDPVGAFIQRPMRPVAPSIAHAIFLDLTHDNPCPVQTRTVFDLFPSAAIVSMACCATGSSRGYDELVPYHVHVVNEKRLYCSWTDSTDDEWEKGAGLVNINSGIIAGKRILDQLHYQLGMGGFTEVFVDQVAEDVVAVTRHNPISHESIILAARTCFRPDQVGRATHVKPLSIAGIVEDIMFEAKLVYQPKDEHHGPRDISRPKASKKWPGADKFVLGTPDYHLEIREHVKFINSEMIEINPDVAGQLHEIEFTSFPPGGVIALKVSMYAESRQAILNLRNGLTQFGYRLRSLSGGNLKVPSPSSSSVCVSAGDDIRSIADRMTLQDMNIALFRCHEEEADEGWGGGSYNVPGFGSFVYCGLQGVMAYLTDIRLKNDLGHPVCDNIRRGNWLVDYMCKRLLQNPGTKELGMWFTGILQLYNRIPHYLRPCYFDAVVTGVYNILRDATWNKMSGFVQEGSFFERSLALNSVAFCGYSKSADLPKLSGNIRPPLPQTRLRSDSGQREQACTTISAGLPHFTCGLFRNWGRDTFIALPGLTLVTGRYDEARYIILAFAGTLRHGLIPNLLGSGTHARYNCRDAVWWWLHAIKCYYTMAGEEAGSSLLNDTVRRLYPTDDAVAYETEKEEPLHVTMQEALQKHFQGIDFIERNAGKAIDEHMKEEGFSVKVGIDMETGFVYGGNEWNCGTWMDKMGSSDRAGNRGRPATPRDGSAVELVGLSAAVIGWLAKMAADKKYPYEGVKRVDDDGVETVWTWSEWAERIKANFKTHFWISPAATQPISPPSPNSEAKYVNARGIYKDSYKATQRWADYQLRPNFPIALAVAPEICKPENAWTALTLAEERLEGPLGMRTLDPKDWAYNGFYDNTDDSHDAKKAKGFNYHQGPEWVWVMGYFLRAKLATAWRLRSSQQDIWPNTIASVQKTLSNHLTHLQSSPWRSLPELTNKDGVFCPGSCPAQAWSVGCILEVIHDLNKYESNGGPL